MLCMLCCAVHVCRATHAVLADKRGRNILPPGLGSAGQRSCAVHAVMCMM